MASPSVTYSFTNGTTADATQVNQNFTDLINSLSDGTKNISVSAGTFAGTVSANGNVILGASSANTVTFNASLGASVPVSTNTSYDLGSSTLGLRSVYIGGSSTYTVRLLGGTQSASYTLTLPTAPPGVSGYPLQMDTSGVVTVSGSTTVVTLLATTSVTIGNGGVAMTYVNPSGANVNTIRFNVTGGVGLQPLDSSGNGPVLYPLTSNTMRVFNDSHASGFPILVGNYGAANGWLDCSGIVTFTTTSGTISAISSVIGTGFTPTGNSTTTLTITFSTAFASANYLVYALLYLSGGSPQFLPLTISGSTSFTLSTSGLTNNNWTLMFMARGERSSTT